MRDYLPSLISNAIFLALLLGSAGRLNYWPAWTYVAISLLMSVLTRQVLRGNPALAMERARAQPGAKVWDKRLLGLGFLLTLAILIVAGLDAGRFNASPLLWPSFVVGVVLMLLGMGLFLFALKENRFFSAVVRIQRERNHTVCNTGPYRWIRHPGYTGMIIGTLGIPPLLMSKWSFIPALLFVAVLVVRTYLEDKTLTDELEGYQAYRQETRARLIPWVW